MERRVAAKPSKVEAIKIASQYLKTFVADEARNGLSHFTEDAATVLKFHGSYQQDDRDLRTLMKREGKEKAYSVHGPDPDRRRQAHRRPVPGRRPTRQHGRQRHAPDHDPPGIPAPRRPEGRPADDDPDDQRDAALDPGRLRRRRAERALLPRAAPRRRPRRHAGRRRPLRLALRPAVVELLGHLARRREDRATRSAPARPDPGSDRPATTRSSRSTARRTCPGSSRRPSPCPRTTAPTSTPTTSASWRSSRRAGSSATTSWSAAAWARPRVPRRRSRSWACRSATSTGRHPRGSARR